MCNVNTKNLIDYYWNFSVELTLWTFNKCPN